ncbi:hypothetical protein COV93_08225 [Candidatus Woesearchaeota archaeon CG11_big_fil_rev_8_21_14_0_20_43_8]|nr:MAG: hypothetical protein COV93_08225 [Candidatus Woesearchaeota archaeon CG11_big_fil_rev_8_21_14_0_20_43_8]PIO08855.1 MAG: hypothetical protein COT47_00925 [Candidatus Woesearchaeota archaeon CG08_land_8_20_14_0_20_43_7]
MFARPEWFKRRKYGGWGVYPATWQGWVYILVLLLPFAIFQILGTIDEQTKTYVTLGWVALVLFDIAPVVVTLRKDEREHKIEAIAERNAAWAMVLMLAIGIGYQAVTKGSFDIFLIITLFAGVAAKAISNIYLERRGI